MVLLDGSRGLEIHAAHAAHAAAGRHRRLVLLRGLGHHRFGGDHQARDRRGVLQRGAGDLGRVQDAELDHVAELAVGGVVAERTRTFDHAVEDDRRLIAGIGHDLAQRGFHRAQGDLDAVVLVFVHALDAGDRRLGTDQGDAAARDDAFLDGRTGRVQGVFDARLLFLHLDFGGGTDLDHRNAAGQLGHALLQLLAVVVGGGLLDLRLDLLDARLDARAFAGAIDDGGVFLRHLDLLGAAEVLDGGLLQRQADFLGNHHAAGQDRHVFQHRLATVAEARGLHRADLDDAADGVDHQGRQRFAFDFLRHDQQRLAGLGHALEDGQQVAHVGDLLVVQQDEGIIQVGRHRLLVVDEVRAQVAAVELHALDHVEFVVQAAAFLDRDHAFLADLVHRLRDQVADVGIRVRGDRADLGDFLAGRRRLGQRLQFADRGLHRLVDAALQVHRVHAGGDRLHALADERLRQHGGGGGAVAGVVGGLGSDFLHHLRAHVLERVSQFDFLGDGDAVLGDGRRAVALLQHDVAALRAEGRLHGVGEHVDAAHHLGARVFAETNVLGSHCELPRKIIRMRNVWERRAISRGSRTGRLPSPPAARRRPASLRCRCTCRTAPCRRP
ncbi:Uncharacterised protein [Acinetobacter baumannii]|nr:hypothetical protein [Acinetobacter baumannii]SSI81913.1 Uncharacterised protein [Acinetobacter baumannii]SSO93569.1 Uncharacterised protein [Acinetobacter baumannii]SSR96774.1 Uncharacterised protein [Acinetobacter baumannii]SSU17925.1 Uncharacterised protein [Acinetobacter baumannii]